MTAVEPIEDSSTATASPRPDEVRALRDRLELRDVRMQRLHAEVLVEFPFDVTAIHIDTGVPEVRVEPGLLECRFRQSVSLSDAEDVAVAAVEVVALVEFAVQGDAEPEPEVVSLFVDRNGYFIAYPYLRQAIQDLTARLGIEAVVLGVLAREADRPTHVSLVRNAAHRAATLE
jgi:preprotein translocase subunit SecB